ncbi:hypothetical protein SAVIM40S_04343 [Streptomyces avidinii]
MTAPAEPSGAAVPIASARGRWILLTTVLGSTMAMLDGTVVNVALPRIGEDLDADLAVLQWTVNAYLLTLAGLILVGGSLSDRFGRRRARGLPPPVSSYCAVSAPPLEPREKSG